MTENTDLTNVPQAESVSKKKEGFSFVWIVPIVAALVGLGIVVQRYLTEGPTIQITFIEAQGIEADKTLIRYKDVEIGKVEKVNLTDNASKILVTAKFDKHAEGMLDKDAHFWIVRPRVTLSGVSGLGTILSGNYIGFEPGKSKEKRRDFVGLEAPPPILRDRPGREFVLRAPTLGSLGIGSPVYYRRLGVGDVIAFDLAKGGLSMEIRIFVNAPYDKFVSPESRFWENSGLEVSAGAEGIEIQTQSVVSLMAGGVVFETPSYIQAAGEAAPNTAFTLFKDRKTAMAPTQVEANRFVVRFKESLQGLSVGAPVKMLGMTFGEVTEVRLEYNHQTRDLRTIVEIVTYPYLIAEHLDKASLALQKAMTREDRVALMQRMVVEKGMRAQLRSGSLISGQLYVALEYFPDAPKAKIDRTQDPPEFPTVPGGMAEVQEKIQGLLAKIDKVPMEEIGVEVKKAVGSFDQAMQSATRTLNRTEGETLPEAKKTLEDLRRAIVTADRVMANADNALVNPDAPSRLEMQNALREIARAAQAVKELADYLERNPSGLIRGKTQEKP